MGLFMLLLARRTRLVSRLFSTALLPTSKPTTAQVNRPLRLLSTMSSNDQNSVPNGHTTEPQLGPDGKPLSKKALKKMEKEKEKSEREAQRAAEVAAQDADDYAKDRYCV